MIYNRCHTKLHHILCITKILSLIWRLFYHKRFPIWNKCRQNIIPIWQNYKHKNSLRCWGLSRIKHEDVNGHFQEMNSYISNTVQLQMTLSTCSRPVLGMTQHFIVRNSGVKHAWAISSFILRSSCIWSSVGV